MAVPPLVVVIMIANNPGDWLEESLTSLVVSDYPNLSLLVVDNGSEIPLKTRVASVAPNAFLVRNEENLGFAAAVNEATKNIHSAVYLMICHDDVALKSDAISVMVEDALRMNASIVAPKLVAWAYPDRVTSLGFDVDRTAAVRSRVDVGDLDQDQFAIVEEVFAASSAAMLVRYDLFEALGGLNDEMFLFGEDVELCFRAQQAGARVVAASYASIRHMGVLVNGPELDYLVSHDETIRRRLGRAERTRYIRANQMRCIAANSSGFTRRVSSLQLWIIALIEAAYFASTGRLKTAQAILAALREGSKKTPKLNARRVSGTQSRILEQQELSAKLAKGSARVASIYAHQRNTRAQVRYEVERARRIDRGALVEKKLIEEEEVDPTSLATRYVQRRLARILQTGVVIYLLLAGRHVLFGTLPVYGQFGLFPRGTSLLSDFFSGSLSPSMPVATSVPASYLWLGTLGTVFFSATSLFYHLFLIALIVTGAIGAYRLGARYKNPLSQSIALVAYVASGALTGAFSLGSLFGVVTFAFVPWLLGITIDFTDNAAKGGKFELRSMARGAFILALATSIAPGFIALYALMVIGNFVAFLFVRKETHHGIVPMLQFHLLVGLAGLALNATWFLGYLSPRATSASLFGASPPAKLDVLHLFDFGMSLSGVTNIVALFLYGAIIAAPFICRGSRHRRAEISMISAVVIAVVMAASNSGLLRSDPLPLIYFAPLMAAFVGFSAATAVDAMYRDLTRVNFGYRQILGVFMLLGILVATLGIGGPVISGRFGLPAVGFEQALGWVNTSSQRADKVLWIGSPSSIPAGSWWFDYGVEFAVTSGQNVSFENIYTPIHLGPYGTIYAGLERVAALETTHLGAYMASSGVSNLIYPQFGVNSAVAKVTLALSRQVDLGQVLTDPSVTGYQVHNLPIVKLPSPTQDQLHWALLLGIVEALAWLVVIDLAFFGAYTSTSAITRVRITFSTERDQKRAEHETTRAHGDSVSGVRLKTGS